MLKQYYDPHKTLQKNHSIIFQQLNWKYIYPSQFPNVKIKQINVPRLNHTYYSEQKLDLSFSSRSIMTEIRRSRGEERYLESSLEIPVESDRQLFFFSYFLPDNLNGKIGDNVRYCYVWCVFKCGILFLIVVLYRNIEKRNFAMGK